MSPRRAFDRFMVDVELGGNPKIGRLTDQEFRCLITGVWALAAKANPRGALRVAEHPADEHDVAHQAHVSKAVARRTLAKLRQLGMLEQDEELGCLVVHDWAQVNPAPKQDHTGANRQAKYRQKLREQGLDRRIPSATRDAVFERDEFRCRECRTTNNLEIDHILPVVAGGDASMENLQTLCGTCNKRKSHRHKGVTSRVTDGSVTGGEVEVEVGSRREEQAPPSPQAPQGVSGEERRRQVQFAEWIGHHEQTTGHQPPKAGTKALRALTDSFGARLAEGLTLDELKTATIGAYRDPYRREHGYDTADSVLRPTKIAALIARGRMPSQGAAAAQQPKSAAEIIEIKSANRRPAA